MLSWFLFWAVHTNNARPWNRVFWTLYGVTLRCTHPPPGKGGRPWRPERPNGVQRRQAAKSPRRYVAPAGQAKGRRSLPSLCAQFSTRPGTRTRNLLCSVAPAVPTTPGDSPTPFQSLLKSSPGDLGIQVSGEGGRNPGQLREFWSDGGVAGLSKLPAARACWSIP